MAFADIYYNTNYHHTSSSILTHQPYQEEEHGGDVVGYSYYYYHPNSTTTTTSKEEDNNSLLYTSNEFIHQYNLLADDQPQQLTPLLTPSPQLSDESNYYKANTLYQHSPDEQDMSLFEPIPEEKKKKNKKHTTHRKRKGSSSSSSSASLTTHICPICDHQSKRKHNLIEHMLTHNPHRPKTFLCSHCSRPFARKYDMKRHEKIHTRR